MKRLVMHTLAAACLATAVGPVLANATSSATIGNLVITLTDLNTTDGISPWMTFTLPSFGKIQSFSYGSGETNDSQQSIHIAGPEGGLYNASAVTDWATSSASLLSSKGIGGFTTLSAQGAAGSGLDGSGNYMAGASAADAPPSQFTLSANTKVTFSVLADVKAQTTMGYNLDADMGEAASALALLNLFGEVNGFYQSDSQQHVALATFDVRDDNTTMGVTDAWSGILSASFINDSMGEATGGLQVLTYVEGVSAVWDGVTPVPEPSTYAMMLGGLGLIGTAARRRSKKAV